MSRFLYQLTLPLSQHVMVVLSLTQQCAFVFTFPNKLTILNCTPDKFENLLYWGSKNPSTVQVGDLELVDETPTPHDKFMEQHRVWALGFKNDDDDPVTYGCAVYWFTEIQHQEALEYLATRGLHEEMVLPPDKSVEHLLWLIALLGEPKIVTGEEAFNIKPERVTEIA